MAETLRSDSGPSAVQEGSFDRPTGVAFRPVAGAAESPVTAAGNAEVSATLASAPADSRRSSSSR